MAILLLAEHTNGALQAATGKAVAAAKQIGGDIHVLVAGHNAKPAAEAPAELAMDVEVAERRRVSDGLDPQLGGDGEAADDQDDALEAGDRAEPGFHS